MKPAEKDLKGSSQGEGAPVPVSLPTDFEAVYFYCNPGGNEYARTYRYPADLPDREADPYRRDGEAWVHRIPGNRFPYRVETLNGGGRPVLIVEGEKCADAAAGKLKDGTCSPGWAEREPSTKPIGIASKAVT